MTEIKVTSEKVRARAENIRALTTAFPLTKSGAASILNNPQFLYILLVVFVHSVPFPVVNRPTEERFWVSQYRRIHADVIVYIFAHLHTALRIEGNMLDMNSLQAAKELVKLSTW